MNIQDLEKKIVIILEVIFMKKAKFIIFNKGNMRSDGRTYFIIETSDDNKYEILYNNDDPNNLYYFDSSIKNPEILQVSTITQNYITLINKIYATYSRIYRPLLLEGETIPSGGKRIAHAAPAAPSYKLNGEKVHLLINKKKLHRSVYVKGNGKAKYCKINYEFVLLSKLKNKII
jgi:hypothetical protein